MNKHSIVYTNDNCIGCNKCINVCSAIGACISKEENGKARIVVDESKCVACGSCIDVCVHGAREFEDDTERFFEDLKAGKNISLLIAPAFKANYPDEYEETLGGLKALGVNRMINVSFGADICTWGYLNYIKKYDFVGGISQPCPAVVSYVERYLPELLPKVFPVQSPLMCSAIYARKYMGVTEDFAFISPCIAKKLEIEDEHNKGLVQYNVTFDHLMKYVREHNIKGEKIHSDVEYGLGSFYPTPGGLAENVRWFLGDSVFIRQIEGERHLYDWMHKNKDRIENTETPFLFIDALNCKNGCICGTAVNPEMADSDDALYNLLKIREEAKKEAKGDAWSKNDTPEERLANLNKQFEDLDLNDYLRSYTDLSESCRYMIPNEEEIDRIFNSMNKTTEESRKINCTCCGYEGCRQMATAIYNGFNHKENCIYYEKTMVRELEIEKKIAEETSVAKGAFLANMSHEIRTPINAIMGMNEMILRESRDPDILEYAQNIKGAGNSLLGLVNNILDFSKIESGKIEIIPTEYDLSSVVNDLINMIQLRADEKNLLLKLDIDPETPKRLYGDELRLKQVITNILTNAVKYTEEGSVTFTIGYEDDPADPRSVLLKVAVEDTGVGIRQEDIKKLFSEFERIDIEKNRNIEGTGLGMAITGKLLDMMGSKLYVDSTYGKGSKFSFAVRQIIVKREPLGNYAETYKAVAISKAKYKEKLTAPEALVLVVDDNPMNLMVFKSLLKATGLWIDTANSGDEGLDLSRKKKYDMIFLDHMMPDKDGIETLHELRAEKDNPNVSTPTVCLTANAISGAREYYIGEGFDDYLTKPIDPAKMDDMLLYYLPKDKVIMTAGGDNEEDANEELPEELKPLDGQNVIDVRIGLMNSGSVDSYMPLLKIYYESYDERAEEIQNFLDSKDYKDYTIKVHAAKSSARIIGAINLSDEAQALENAGKMDDIDYITAHHDEYMAHGREVKELLAKVFERKEPAKEVELQEADEEILNDCYYMLQQAAESLDCNTIELVFDELRDFKIPEEHKDRLVRIKKAADKLDYDGMLEILKDVKH